MDKYEELAEKIAENLEFKDIVESFIYHEAKRLREDKELFKRMKKHYEVTI